MSRHPQSRRRSEAQRAASRANGAKSRGPKTPEGKAVSARNALKHGFSAARFSQLSGDDEHYLATLLAALQARFGPIDEIGERLVRQLARVMWQIERAERWEADVLASGGGVDPNTAISGRKVPVRHFYRVIRLQQQLEQRFSTLLEQLAPEKNYCQNEPKTPNL